MNDLARITMFSSQSTDWCTPQEVLDLVEKVAQIGLDPCGGPGSIVRARKTIYPPDGLDAPWRGNGLVYVNPPYGRHVRAWLSKADDEFPPTSNGVVDSDACIMLLPARTDVAWFHAYIVRAAAVCFWRGRIVFHGAEAGAPFPSLLAFWGGCTLRDRFIEAFGPAGFMVQLMDRKGYEK